MLLFGGLWAAVSAKMAIYDRTPKSQQETRDAAENQSVELIETELGPLQKSDLEEESFSRPTTPPGAILNFGINPQRDILSILAILIASVLLSLRKRAGLVLGRSRRLR